VSYQKRATVLRLCHVLSLAVLVFVWCLLATDSAIAQWMGKQTDCYADSIEANPNRPTVSNPAHVTQYGVLELEYGFDRMWPEIRLRQTSGGGLLKFGLLCDLELRWATTSFLSQADSTGMHTTFGDNWLGTEIRFHRQTRRLPTMAFSYSFKIPSARTEDGLGTGQVDHSFTLGASETVAHFTFDFNFTQFLLGQPSGGFDQNQQMALAFSHVLHKKLQFAGELYGQTENISTPDFASSLWALTYALSARLVLDGGFEAGLTSGGPHRHAFGGITYSIANLYPGWRRKPSKSR
jgi:hypothetical protein